MMVFFLQTITFIQHLTTSIIRKLSKLHYQLFLLFNNIIKKEDWFLMTALKKKMLNKSSLLIWES